MFTKEEIEQERENAKLKQIMDYNSAMADSYERGYQKGYKIGLQKAIERMTKHGVSLEKIAHLTDLTQKEVIQIQSEIA